MVPGNARTQPTLFLAAARTHHSVDSPSAVFRQLHRPQAALLPRLAQSPVAIRVQEREHWQRTCFRRNEQRGNLPGRLRRDKLGQAFGNVEIAYSVLLTPVDVENISDVVVVVIKRIGQIGIELRETEVVVFAVEEQRMCPAQRIDVRLPPVLSEPFGPGSQADQALFRRNVNVDPVNQFEVVWRDRATTVGRAAP